MVDVHTPQHQVEEHADGHHDVDDAHAHDGRDQSSLLHRDACNQLSDRDRRLGDRGERPEHASQQVRRRAFLRDRREDGVNGP